MLVSYHFLLIILSKLQINLDRLLNVQSTNDKLINTVAFTIACLEMQLRITLQKITGETFHLAYISITAKLQEI